MFNVAMHNISTGVFFLNAKGQFTREPEWLIDSHHQACTVAKAQADKHKCIYCVHNANGHVTKTFRPSVVSMETATKEKEKERQKVKRMKEHE